MPACFRLRRDRPVSDTMPAAAGPLSHQPEADDGIERVSKSNSRALMIAKLAASASRFEPVVPFPFASPFRLSRSVQGPG
jgi:hypothetical protein